MRSLGNEIPSYTVSVVWERQEPILWNKLFNCNPELFLTTPSLNVCYTWKVLTESPASPGASGVTDRRRSSSPCLNLDELSSSDDDMVGSVRLSDLLVTLLCSSDDGHTPVNSDQVLSDVDLPPETVSDDKRQVIRPGLGFQMDSSKDGLVKRMPLPVCIPAMTTSGQDLDVSPRLSGPIRPRWSEQ